MHLKYDALVAHLSQPKFSEWYTPGKSKVFDALASQPIDDDDDLTVIVNSHISVKKQEGIAIECRDPAWKGKEKEGSTMRLV